MSKITCKLLSICAGAFAVGSAAYGGAVTFDTLQSQLCLGAFGCGVHTQVIGGLQITFAGVNQTIIASPGAGGFLGSLIVSCVGGGLGCVGGNLAGLNLYIVVTETSPLAGTVQLPTGVLAGTISGSSGVGTVNWVAGSGVIGGSTFTPVSPIQVCNPSICSGGNVAGVFTDAPSTAPEPASAVSVASGLLLFLGLAARARSQRARQE